MQFHELVGTSMIIHAVHVVPWACMQLHDLACSSMSLHAVPKSSCWAAHKIFAVLVNLGDGITIRFFFANAIPFSISFVQFINVLGGRLSSFKIILVIDLASNWLAGGSYGKPEKTAHWKPGLCFKTYVSYSTTLTLTLTQLSNEIFPDIAGSVCL